MAKNEKTGKNPATLAGIGLKNPSKLTNSQIKTVCATALTQTPDKPKGGKKK